MLCITRAQLQPERQGAHPGIALSSRSKLQLQSSPDSAGSGKNISRASKKKNDRWLTLWGAEILGHHLLTLLCQHGSLKPLAFTWPPKENKEQGEARCSARGCAGRGSRCCSEGAWGCGVKPQGRLRAQWGDATGWRSWGEKLG